MDSTIRQQFRRQGFYLFWWQRRYGRDGRRDRVGLYPDSNQYVVLRAMLTGSPDTGPDRISEWLQALEQDHPLTLISIGPNFFEGRLVTDSADASELARRFSEFCPDLERRGAVTTERRAESLREGGYFRCWWEAGAR